MIIYEFFTVAVMGFFFPRELKEINLVKPSQINPHKIVLYDLMVFTLKG